MKTKIQTAAHLLALALFLAAPSLAAQQSGEGMDRTGGIIGIQNEAERQVFSSLICPCGCPREALSTCTCGMADGYRRELRGMLAQGMTLDQIKAEWVRRHGGKALFVPENEGINRALYIVPFLAIIGMAVVFGYTLRRYVRRGERSADGQENQKPEPKPKGDVAGATGDDYDKKLDEELSKLDDE